MKDRWQTYHAHCEPFRLYPDRALAAAHRADLQRDRGNDAWHDVLPPPPPPDLRDTDLDDWQGSVPVLGVAFVLVVYGLVWFGLGWLVRGGTP